MTNYNIIFIGLRRWYLFYTTYSVPRDTISLDKQIDFSMEKLIMEFKILFNNKITSLILWLKWLSSGGWFQFFKGIKSINTFKKSPSRIIAWKLSCIACKRAERVAMSPWLHHTKENHYSWCIQTRVIMPIRIYQIELYIYHTECAYIIY